MTTIDIIKNRETIKYLSDEPIDAQQTDHQLIDKLMESAYWAPFHKPCEQEHTTRLRSILPFRFYILDAKNCRHLATYLKETNKALGKLIPMLNATDYLIQATWLPNEPKTTLADHYAFEATVANMEHIAATAAAIQNILLTATELNIDSYWSSGGDVLREVETFNRLGMDTKEILLGSIYINLKKENAMVESLNSKLRNKRGDLQGMYTFIDLDSTK